jgi:hypothetical protein
MDQNRSRNEEVPNRESNMEQAEGSRDQVTNSESSSSRGRSGGISNRPLDREQCEQEQIPERGESQSER